MQIIFNSTANILAAEMQIMESECGYKFDPKTQLMPFADDPNNKTIMVGTKEDLEAFIDEPLIAELIFQINE